MNVPVALGRGLATALLGWCASAAAQPPLDWQARVEVASGPAERGPWQQNESRYRFVDDPAVALADDGSAAVAWVDQAHQDIFFQAYTPDGEAALPQPANVSGSGDVFSWLPRVVLDADDPSRVYVLWQEIVFSGGSHGGEAFFARSLDGGRTFGEPLNLSRSRAGDGKGRLSEDFWHNGSLDLVQAPDGDLYAAWTEYEGALWFARSSDGGESFSEPVRVFESGALPAGAPTLAAGEADAVYLAWGVGEDPAADIHFTQSRDGGRSFAPPRALFDSGGHAWGPKLAVGPRGTVHLVYGESERGPRSRSRVLYTRATDLDAGFAAPRVLPTVDAPAYVSASFPDIAVDARNRLLVVWGLFEDPSQRPTALGYTASTDGGATFAKAHVVPQTIAPERAFLGSTQGLLMDRLAANSEGQVALGSSIFLEGRHSHVWLHLGYF